MKRKILRLIDLAAISIVVLAGSAADWTPIHIMLPLLLMPCAYIGLRQWAERSLNERN